MAKKQQRGNREQRKPKKEKPKSTPQVSPFGPSNKSGAGKKPT